MRTRSEATSKKPSAAERTKDLPFEEEEKSVPEKQESSTPVEGSVTCEACESVLEIAKLEKRTDGLYECSECGAPVNANAKAIPKAEKKEKPAPKEEPKSKPEEPKNGARSGTFCAECGSEWPLMNGEVSPNCGHKNDGVNDPRKAEKPKTITPSGIARTPNLPASTFTQPQISMSGNRLSIGWGKSTFPFGEVTGGPKYANFEVPQAIITIELPPDADRVESAKPIIAELLKIAELVFQAEYKWYREKLRGLDAK